MVTCAPLSLVSKVKLLPSSHKRLLELLSPGSCLQETRKRQKETIHSGIGTLQGPCCHALSRDICSQHFYFIPKITLQGTNLITPICFLHRKDKVRANIEDVAKPRFVSHSGNQSPDVHLLNQVVCAY